MGNMFTFGNLERHVEVKVGDEVRRLPMLSINEGRELADIMNQGFVAAEKLAVKDANHAEINKEINDARNKAVEYLRKRGIDADIADYLAKFAGFQELVAFSSYLRTGVNFLELSEKETTPPQETTSSKKKKIRKR